MRNSRRAGILLEAILALLFITLGVGAVAGLFSSSMAKVRQVRLRTRAMTLAETMLAEFQTGLIDITEGQSGDFAGKPANYYWEIEQESTEVPELKRLKISITYDDPADGFTYTVYRLFSPSLNLSAEQMKEISTDPVQMQALGGTDSGLQDLLEMLSEFPGGDQIANALLKGGVPGMMTIFNKVVGGNISAEELMSLMGGESSSGTVESMIIGGEDEDAVAGEPWSDYDTAGIGEKPSSTESTSELADATDQAEPENPEETPDTQPTQADTSTNTNTTPGMMTRDEAIKRMQEMLRRIANKPK